MLKDRHSQTDSQICEQTGGKKGRQTDRQSDMCVGNMNALLLFWYPLTVCWPTQDPRRQEKFQWNWLKKKI